ncbi:MAG: hypothetical protein ABJA87_02025 [bacterium]
MSAMWQCAVCETINDGGRICTACGAEMTRRSAVATTVRGRLAPVAPPPAPSPLPSPIQRAINREPLEEAEWEYYEPTMNMVPLPDGCLFTIRPRRRDM